jgi:polar amino acid transport system substrate-binding protein
VLLNSLPKALNRLLVRAAVLAAFASLSGAVTAGCSRPINVPIATVGLSVFVGPNNRVSGVYPDVLLSGAAKAGCSFNFTVVPRARLEALFTAGQADLLIPASKSPRRDELGIFVPLIHSRATLISLMSQRPVMLHTQDVLDRTDLKVGVVRGFDFGPVYIQLVKDLTQQGRVVQEVDALSVARLLMSGAIDLAIMSPSILVGSIHGQSMTEGLLERLRVEPLEEFTWGDSGAYISKASLSEADQNTLRVLLEQSSSTGAVWNAFQKHYPAKSLEGSIRTR